MGSMRPHNKRLFAIATIVVAVPVAVVALLTANWLVALLCGLLVLTQGIVLSDRAGRRR
jgi:hypothetical protein